MRTHSDRTFRRRARDSEGGILIVRLGHQHFDTLTWGLLEVTQVSSSHSSRRLEKTSPFTLKVEC